MKKISAELVNYVLEQTCAIQQIPAPTFSESERAEYVLKAFQSLDLEDVYMDEVGNVFGCLPGTGDRELVISAHLDTVHPLGSVLPLQKSPDRITGPGIGDNSLGLAALLGLAHWLKETNTILPGRVWLAANVCEEGLGNLRGMNALVDRFEADPIAYIILEGMGLGQICHRGLGVIRYRVTAETAGGHSWVDYGQPSAIHELAAVVSRLDEISLPKKPRTTLNVGIIQGGTSINTIASNAWFDLDLRSEDHNTLSKLVSRFKRTVESRERNGVTFKTEMIGSRPAGVLGSNHPLINLCSAVLSKLDITSTLEIGSTDANIPLSRGYPAVCIGLTKGGSPHTHNEYIEIEPVRTGMEQLIQIVIQAWDRLD